MYQRETRIVVRRGNALIRHFAKAFTVNGKDSGMFAMTKTVGIKNEANLIGGESVGGVGVTPDVAQDDDGGGGDDEEGESDRRRPLKRTPALPPAVANFDSLPSQARIRTSEVLLIMGLSRTTLHRRVIAQAFPPPRKTPTGQNFWTADDVRRALAQS